LVVLVLLLIIPPPEPPIRTDMEMSLLADR
jgi:hypothetical protein